ncbi:MAG: HigA family addiction module antitoxin [Acidobacteriota bacterium]
MDRWKRRFDGGIRYSVRGRCRRPATHPTIPDALHAVHRRNGSPLRWSTFRAAIGLLSERRAQTRPTLSELVNGKRGISPEMAVRLSKVFGGSAEGWLVQQAQYDLARVRTNRMKLKRLDLA